MKISLLHPTRKRVEKSRQATERWLSNAVSPVELIVSIDSNDPFILEYQRIYSGRPNVKLIVNENRSAVDAINNAAKAATGDLFIVVSDDTDCPRKWDQIIFSAVEGKSDFVLKVWDGQQPWIITMPVMDRTYYNRFGYVYYHEFKHMFCDTYLTHVADALKRIIWRNDIVFEHLHYSNSKARTKKDEINEVADATFEHGKHIYSRLVRENLRLPATINICNLSEHAASHEVWLRKAGLWNVR